MTRLQIQAAAVAVGAALLALSGCGSREEEPPAPGIPQATATRLAQELDLVQDRLDVTRRDGAIGACEDIGAKSYPDIHLLVEALPADTDREVRSALDQSLARLKELTGAECERLVQEIRDRREETTPEPAPPAVTTEPEPPPEQTDTDVGSDAEPKQKPKKKDDENSGGGIGPDGGGPPGLGGGQPAPGPAPAPAPVDP